MTLSFRVDLDQTSLVDLAGLLQKEANASLADVADLVPGEVCAVKIALQDEDAPAGELTLPPVVSSPEAAAILRISRQRLHQIRTNPDFPRPLFQLPTGPIWAKDVIERYAATRQKRRQGPGGGAPRRTPRSRSAGRADPAQEGFADRTPAQPTPAAASMRAAPR